MRDVDMDTLALKLAEALLLHEGKISVRDIQAIPFLTHPKDAELIARYLRGKLRTRISTLRNKENETSTWEELITLVQ